jgi:hypothetical protein
MLRASPPVRYELHHPNDSLSRDFYRVEEVTSLPERGELMVGTITVLDQSQGQS